MLSAPIYENELERLDILLNYEILDTPPEEIFDELTKAASKIFQVPIALISLVDKERQWFKSKVGLEANQTPRNVSFCGHAIHSDDIFMVNDATKDERFKDNPLVLEEPQVTFYAGAPLVAAQGYKIGTFCLIDHKPRELSSEQLEILKFFAKLTRSYLEIRLQNKIIHQLNKDLKSSSAKIKETTAELVHKSKLASLSQIAAGISHELNNPLTIIIGKANMIANMIALENICPIKISQHIEKIISTAERAAMVVQGLQDISNSSEEELFYQFNLMDMLNNSLIKLREKNKVDDIEIDLCVDQNLEIECQHLKIIQCFFHLFNNSLSAIENLQEKWICVTAHERDQYIEILFTDSGQGIRDPKILAGLMAPFFSTKEVGQGIGIGLAVVKGIVIKHRGEFYLNEKEKNTQFVIMLPKNQENNAVKKSLT